MDRLPTTISGRRRRRLLLLATATAAAAVGAYKLYHLPSVSRQRRRIARLAATAGALADSAAAAGDAAALVSSDLSRFLLSDSDEIPTSLKQIAKLAASDEASASLSRVSESIAAGILRGSGSSSAPESSSGGRSFSDRVLDKFFSGAGAEFASAVSGSFARSAVLAFYSDATARRGSNSDAAAARWWVEVVAGERFRAAVVDWVNAFVGTAVEVFIDKTIHINTYDQLFAGLVNPAHEDRVKELLVAVSNAAIETLVKTSHRVLTVQEHASRDDKGATFASENANAAAGSASGCGWVDTVSSTLAVPSNRRFVLDVTGRVTFETVRSFLEFVLWKLHDGARIGGDAAVEAGQRVVRYIGLKSMLIATICISLCLHILNGTRFLVPA